MAPKLFIKSSGSFIVSSVKPYMLGGLIVGSQQWAGNSGEYLRVPFEATFELSDPVIDQAALSSFEKEGQANE